jgi:hypothetical protein
MWVILPAPIKTHMATFSPHSHPPGWIAELQVVSAWLTKLLCGSVWLA